MATLWAHVNERRRARFPPSSAVRSTGCWLGRSRRRRPSASRPAASSSPTPEQLSDSQSRRRRLPRAAGVVDACGCSSPPGRPCSSQQRWLWPSPCGGPTGSPHRADVGRRHRPGHQQARRRHPHRLHVVADRRRRGTRSGSSIRRASTLTRIDPKTMEIVPPSRGIPAPTGSRSDSPSARAPSGSPSTRSARSSCSSSARSSATCGEHRFVLHRAGAGSLSVASETVVLAVGEGAVWALERGAGGGDAHRSRRRSTPSLSDDGLAASRIAVGGGSVWLGGRTGVTRLDPETGTELDDRARAERGRRRDDVDRGRRRRRLVRRELAAEAVAPHAGRRPLRLVIRSQPGRARSPSRRRHRLGGEQRGRSVTALRSQDGVDRETIELGSSPAGIVAEYGSVWTSPGEPAS